MRRIPMETLEAALAGVLRELGFAADRAQACARLFAETTCDGVYTHGVSRFPRFVETIRNGCVDPAAEPACRTKFGAVERWDGQKGPGNLNAQAAMARAMALSGEHGVGVVSLGNTNHWMRGGSYGWQAAEAGCIGICWTNTMPNLPPWGGRTAAIGNNPLVIAVPRANGPVVLDMAMSQFSYGALESYRRRGEALPMDGGFDAEGRLTRDAAAIEASQRPLPVGFWKGSGLAVVLDMIAAMTALGKATHELPADPVREAGVSQVFVAMKPEAFGPAEETERIADGIVESIHACAPAEGSAGVRYPGEKTLATRAENRRLGVPVEEGAWEAILAMPGAGI
ncbi:MAG TPA: 3-dehydro-L-gulonate 2-dehydrogenase [Terracidiphilus sp.]|nr:3-dehydro-L-gulonate 2-dehydrogenase [Terracidiphilus sp.]